MQYTNPPFLCHIEQLQKIVVVVVIGVVSKPQTSKTSCDRMDPIRKNYGPPCGPLVNPPRPLVKQASHGSVSVFNVGIGIRYRYFKISQYRFGISVFQLVHFKGAVQRKTFMV